MAIPTVEDAARRKLAGDYMTQEEAHEVYDACWALWDANPEVKHAFKLLRMLDRETTTGERCSVCSRVDDARCRFEC